LPKRQVNDRRVLCIGEAARKGDRDVYARMSIFEGSTDPDRMDEGLRHVREQTLPQLRQQDGFKGLIALGDRQTGKSVGITLWVDEAAMRASEEEANRMRDESAEAADDTIANVQRYEVAVFEVES
jgi:hypothetical protein